MCFGDEGSNTGQFNGPSGGCSLFCNCFVIHREFLSIMIDLILGCPIMIDNIYIEL